MKNITRYATIILLLWALFVCINSIIFMLFVNIDEVSFFIMNQINKYSSIPAIFIGRYIKKKYETVIFQS